MNYSNRMFLLIILINVLDIYLMLAVSTNRAQERLHYALGCP